MQCECPTVLSRKLINDTEGVFGFVRIIAVVRVIRVGLNKLYVSLANIVPAGVFGFVRIIAVVRVIRAGLNKLYVSLANIVPAGVFGFVRIIAVVRVI